MNEELKAKIEQRMPAVREMLLLQAKQNDVVDPQWLTAGHEYLRAAAHEAVELQDHLGWKWWKLQVQNLDQAYMELVDMYHFILSAILIACRGDIDEAEQMYVISSMGDLNTPVFPGNTATTLAGRNPLERIDGFIGCAAFGYCYIFVFDQICEDWGLSFERLHRMYVAKGVLNVFRQKHGYKEGTYLKLWFGEEDNVHLTRMMEYYENASATQLGMELEILYMKAQAEAQGLSLVKGG